MIDRAQNASAPEPSPAPGGAGATAFALLDGLWHGPVGVAVLDRGLRFVQVNDPFAEVNGVAAAAHVGRTFPEVAAANERPVREEMERLEDACRVVVATGRPFLNLVVRGRSTGEREPEWLCSVFPIPAADGSVRGALATVSDATYDREREAALARARDDAERARALLDALVENAPIGIGFFDRELRFRRLNQLLADMDGLTVQAHLGRTLREVLPGLPHDRIERALQQVIETGQPMLDVEIEGETPTAPGKRRTWVEAWYPVRAGEEVLGVGALVQEVTAEREGEEFRRNVLGIVGHDLRNPLAAVVNLASLLSRAEDLPGERRRIADRILANAARMQTIISVLLDYARVRAGQRLPLHPRRCGLAAIVEGVAQECEAAHPGREIRRGGSGDPAGSWDPDRVAQVLANLLSNALDFGWPGTPVELTWRCEEELAVVEVANRGAPIPGDVLPWVFEPFRKAERQRAGGRDGLGLGLFIARAIATAHGGRLDVRSGEGDRTVFALRLPRGPDAP